MAKIIPRVPATAPPPKITHSDRDGNHIHNEILLALPPQECEMLLAELEFVRLRTGQLLHEVGDTLKSAYF